MSTRSCHNLRSAEVQCSLWQDSAEVTGQCRGQRGDLPLSPTQQLRLLRYSTGYWGQSHKSSNCRYCIPVHVHELLGFSEVLPHDNSTKDKRLDCDCCICAASLNRNPTTTTSITARRFLTSSCWLSRSIATSEDRQADLQMLSITIKTGWRVDLWFVGSDYSQIRKKSCLLPPRSLHQIVVGLLLHRPISSGKAQVASICYCQEQKEGEKNPFMLSLHHSSPKVQTASLGTAPPPTCLPLGGLPLHKYFKNKN